MEFKLLDAAQYRALDDEAFEARKADLLAALNDPDCKFTSDELIADKERFEAELRRRNAEVELRNAKLAAVANGAGTVVARSNPDNGAGGSKGTIQSLDPDDPFDTPEYHRAFFEYVTRGKRTEGIVVPGTRPDYVRADQFTTVASDVPNFVPTTLMNEILEKEEVYGEIYPLLSKTNVQGGVEFNVADFDVEAKWVDENTPSEDQKLTDDDRVTFNYYMLEVKLSQSILSSVTTLSAFQAKFPEVAAKAMVQAKEKAFINGTGTGQMLGVLKDSRVPAENKISLTADDISGWQPWHAKVKSKIKRPYNSGVFMMAQGTWDTYIDGMVTSDGQPVARCNYGINGEETYRFMGKQVMIVPDDILPDFDTASNGNAFAVFMRLSDYMLNNNMGMRSVRWIDEDNNKVKLKLQEILDGKILRPWGVYILNKSAA